MLMSEIKPFVIDYFNSKVTDEFAREYIDVAFDLWINQKSKYDTENNAYKAVILRWVTPINLELKKLNLLAEQEFTKKTETKGNETNNIKIDSNSKTTQNDGKFVTNALIYPDAYSGETDDFYRSNDVVNNEFEQTVAGENNSETSSKKDNTSGVNETDNLAYANSIQNSITQIQDLIEGLVFEFVCKQITKPPRWGCC